MTSTIKADVVTAQTTDGAVTIQGNGTGTVAIGDNTAITGTLSTSGTPTFSSTNDMSVGGSILLTTAAKGIYLGVTSVTAANLLDDYEEGTWTPAFTSTSATFAYAYQVGSYTKVGTLVQCEYRLALSGSPGGTTTNGTIISGLPFTFAAVTNLYYGLHVGHFYNINLDSNEQAGIALQGGSSGTTFELKGLGDNVGEQAILASQLGAAAQIRGSITYRTA